MRSIRQLLVFSLLVVFSAVGVAADRQPMSIEDSIDVKTASAAAISPDGTRVLYLLRAWEWPDGKPSPDKGTKPPESRTHIWIVPADGSGPPRQLTFGEKGESSPAWSPDGRFISFVSARGKGDEDSGGPKPQVWLLPLEGGEPWQLTDVKEGVESSYAWSEDGKQIAFLSQESRSEDESARRKRKDDETVFEADGQPAHAWAIDVASKQAIQLTSGKAFTVKSVTWSPDSRQLAITAAPTTLTRDGRSDVRLVTVATKDIQRVATPPGDASGPAWSPDGRAVAFLLDPHDARSNGDGLVAQPVGNSHLMLYDVTSGRARDVYDPKLDLSFGNLAWTRDSGRVLAQVGRRVYRDVYAYDVSASRYEPLTRDRIVLLGPLARTGDRVAFMLDSTGAPPDVHVSDLTFSAPRKLTDVNPQVAGFSLGDMEVITWKSPDGWPVEGLLLKPAGYQPGQRYPLVVEIHGGPTGAHLAGFKAGQAGGQYWAGQGWAVLYPNPRGSTGYGEKFVRGNIPDWGGGDYRDIMAGVDEVIRRGVADPEKLAVVGWSYGGYMTCWVVTQTSRFKAARIGAGLSNLVSMYGTNDIPNYMESFFGGYPTKETLPLYVERSGLTHVERVTTPVLILHGSNDNRVPIGQPMEFYRALKDRGKTVELVFYPREGHGFSEYYHQRDRLRRDFDWITKYTLGSAPRTSSQ